MGGGIFVALWSFANRQGAAAAVYVPGNWPYAPVAARSPAARVQARSPAALVQPRSPVARPARE